MTEQSNINFHSENREFDSVVNEGLISGGIHVNAGKNHGKTRLLFSIAQKLRSLPNCRVLIFDGSEAWLYGFSKIPVFTVNERDIQRINDVCTTEEIERYTLTNWYLVKLALENYKDILFRLKTRKPSKRGFFIRTVVNHLDALQRTERETTSNNEPKMRIAYFIEEAQDAFNVRSTMRIEAEEFMTVFNEARNNFESFYTCSQRAFDFSKTIRTKQNFCIGKLSHEDVISSFRRLEKQYDINFSKLPHRTWFFEGKTFKSPEWKQNGKPFQINNEVKKIHVQSLRTEPEKPKKKGLFKKFTDAFDDWIFNKYPYTGILTKQEKPSEQELQDEQDEEEDEDVLFL